MGRIAEDLKGRVFGYWTVIEKSDRAGCGDVLWRCECRCGNKNEVRSHGLRNGFSKSCGCMRFKGKTKRERVFGMEISKEKLDFNSLWVHHPANTGELQPCIPDKGKPYESQCCIRMSAALERAGYDLSDYRGMKCWHGHDEVHALRVEEMALYMKKKLGPPEVYSRPDVSEFHGRKGIVVFFDFYNGSGDHFDIYNGLEQAWGCDDYFSRSPKLWWWGLD